MAPRKKWQLLGVIICILSVQLFGNAHNHDMGVVFIKTHKTASSTVSAMLRTNAVLIWNQSIFVPPIGYGGYQWDLNNLEHRLIIRSQKVGSQTPYRFWTSHVKFHDYFNILIPQPKVFVTILRNPVDRLQSAWKYYTKLGVLRKNTSIVYILQNANERTEWNPNGQTMELLGIAPDNVGQEVQIDSLNNQPSYVTPSLEEGHALIVEAIRSKVLTCLITERLHESLSLFWLKMGWNEEDMIYRNIKPTTRPEMRDDTGESFVLSEEEVRLVAEASKLDATLYLEASALLDSDVSRMSSKWMKPRINTCDSIGSDAVRTCAKLGLFNDSPIHELDTSQGQLFEECRCVLLGLDDVEWSEWFHSMQPSPEVRGEHRAALSPLSSCYINSAEVECSVAPESVDQLSAKHSVSSWLQIEDGHKGEQQFRFISVVRYLEGFDGCDVKAEVNSEVNDKYALIVKRGGCSFLAKTETALTLGFQALIIVDNGVNAVPTPSLGVEVRSDIPVFMVSSKQGEEALKTYKGDTDVTFEAVILFPSDKVRTR